MRFEAENPKWVIDEFERMSCSTDIELIRKVLSASPELQAPIWRGLGKRSLRRSMGSLGKLDILAHTIRKGLRPRLGDNRLSPKEKLALANRLSWAAREFAAAWRAAEVATDGFPAAIYGELSEAAFEMLSSIEPYASRLREREVGDDVLYPERALLTEAFCRLDAVAETVSAGAALWGETKLLLDKPRHPNADRLWFIRIVTDSFFLHFGEPMREEVLALTTIWFGDSKLTANAISEIAKVAEILPRMPKRFSHMHKRLSEKDAPPD